MLVEGDDEDDHFIMSMYYYNLKIIAIIAVLAPGAVFSSNMTANMTGGNMAAGNMTDTNQTGSISSKTSVQDISS